MSKFSIRNKINANIDTNQSFSKNFAMTQPKIIRLNAKRETCITRLYEAAVNCLRQS
ncbi:MAG: hypothetical protein NC548_15725 [Lachnospiraceae bacterium]|nr:hypothetical protein [Lachnospiraceae bacterium]